MRFDLLILGDTPDAWTAAEEAALLGRRVAVLRPEVDGDGTAAGIAAILAAYPDDSPDPHSAPPTPPSSILNPPSSILASPRDLCTQALRRHERAISRLGRDLAVRNWRGPARLTGPASAEVFADGVGIAFEADLLLIAPGTAPRRPRGLPFDRRTILLPEDVPHLAAAPERIIVLGANPVARAFARLFEAAGSDVLAIASPPEAEGLRPLALTTGEILDVRRDADGVVLRLTDGRTFDAAALLFAADRVGATASLGLAAAGLDSDEDGRLWCDDDGKTWLPSIAAAGEVVGFPRSLRDDPLAARRIVSQAFDGQASRRLERHPASPIRIRRPFITASDRSSQRPQATAPLRLFTPSPD